MYGSCVEPVNYADLLHHTYSYALEKNIGAQINWNNLKQDYTTLETVLKDLPQDLTKDVMVPVAPKALMQGIIVHTNEILVGLGDGYFVKRSSPQAVEICKRREKICADMLCTLEREQRLLWSRSELPFCQEAFGGGTEIMEEYDEEKEAKWKEKHRRKEHEHRSRLAELRQKECTTIMDEESLWKRLDELELQEELEEELDRLNADRDSDNEEKELVDDNGDEKEDPSMSRKNNTCFLLEVQQPIAAPELEASTQPEVEEKRVPRRRVSFADDGVRCGPSVADEADLRITFSHSACHSIPGLESCGDGPPRTPAELYLRFSSSTPRRSILKKRIGVHSGDGPDEPQLGQQQLSEDEEVDGLPPLLPVADAVVERQAIVSQLNQTKADSTRPSSRFKAERRLLKK